MSFTDKGPNLIVALAGTVSNHIYADGNYEGAYGMVIHSPAILAEAGTIEVTDGKLVNDATNVWRTLQDETPADLAVPAAGKSRFYKQIPFANGFRIKLGGAAAAARTFNTSYVGD